MNSHSCRTNFSMITHLPTKNVSRAYRSTCLATLGLFVPKMNFIQYHTSIQWLLPPRIFDGLLPLTKYNIALRGGWGGGVRKWGSQAWGTGVSWKWYTCCIPEFYNLNGRFRNLPLNLMDLSLKTLIKQPPFQTQYDQRLRVPQTFMINNY